MQISQISLTLMQICQSNYVHKNRNPLMINLPRAEIKKKPQ